MRKGTSKLNDTHITADVLLDKDKVKDIFRADQGYKFMKTVRGTPAYWEQVCSTSNLLYSFTPNNLHT